jgi:hypothetical protein
MNNVWVLPSILSEWYQPKEIKKDLADCLLRLLQRKIHLILLNMLEPLALISNQCSKILLRLRLPPAMKAMFDIFLSQRLEKMTETVNDLVDCCVISEQGADCHTS